jgi:predicted DNA-binding transcriptional regulator AlpA
MDASLGGITHWKDASMRSESGLSGKAAPDSATARPIVLSRWVNEPYPALTDLLSAHDVARLTRRPRWLLAGLVLIGRFPKKAQFRGRAVGWWLSDVLEWMAKDLALERHHPTALQQGRIRQTCLPLESRERCAVVSMVSLVPKHADDE